jgi:hypothetical protein
MASSLLYEAPSFDFHVFAGEKKNMATATLPAPSPGLGIQVPCQEAAMAPVSVAKAAEIPVSWADWLALKVWLVCWGLIWLHVICNLLYGLWSR